MVNKELKSVLDYLEHEKGIDKEVIFSTIKSSLISAARKSVKDVVNPEIDINEDTLDVQVHEKLLVVDDDKPTSLGEINLANAKEINSEATVGDFVKHEVTPKNFGRIAAQTAKQVLLQRLKDAQADVVFKEYRNRVYQVVTGVVRQVENKQIIIQLERGDAVLKQKEQIPFEVYQNGDRVKVLILEVRKNNQNPEIVVSRSHPLFVKKLFEVEVPEISDGIVEIKGVAREAGYRSKIAVFSKESKVDCVGACVGMRGARVKNIVQELNGEKIDIVTWDPDISSFCRNAMNPAKLKHIEKDEETKIIKVYVDKSQFSLAIGKKGHNARLTSKLLGWKLDIEVLESDDQIQKINTQKALSQKAINDAENKKDERLEVSIDDFEGISKKVKDNFRDSGYSTIGDLKKLKIDELYTIPGIGKTSAGEIMDLITKKIDELKAE